ncbi:ATP-binding cassette domain-containing protein [Phyllobacterium sp. SB3]|uniref:ABC transporter ATP-binding protein n=1 Tax=Phyllobacterium sp. SB3 TaxID=3156073 RepID=UPI0032AEE5E9
MSTSTSPVMELRNVSKRFGERTHEGLKGINISLAHGETLAVAGSSGSGKTTLARLVMRLTSPDEGSVHILGQDISRLGGEALRRIRPRFQMVFQDPLAAFNPRANVKRILEDPLRIHGLAGRNEYSDIVVDALQRVGLGADHLERLPRELSGGQRQRVAIARAILTKPQLIVLDEAVSALDVSVRAQILNLLLDLREETGVSYLFISHDLAVVRAFADRMVIMEEGRIAEEGDTETVLANPQANTTRVLIDAVPRLNV